MPPSHDARPPNAAPSWLARIGSALEPNIPTGMQTVAVFYSPSTREIHRIDNLNAEPGAVANVLVAYLLSLNPSLVLKAFELERQAKIAHAVGRATVADFDHNPEGQADGEI